MNPLAADKRFFNALIAGDAQALARFLTDDFILIDVMSGSEITKPAFLAAIRLPPQRRSTNDHELS